MPRAEAEAILIAGPTASGKSALAVRMAREIGAIVVNADSMQVYRDLGILTARPSAQELAEAPHRLFGEVDGAENHSVARYVERAAPLLRQALADGKPTVLVGGTGLYFKALVDGLSEIPAVPDHVRRDVRAASEGRTTPQLHEELARADPVTAATLRTSDRQRVLRALEIYAATGLPLSSFHGSRTPGPLADRRLVRVFLTPDRDELRRRIDARFVAMVEAGALEEVAALARRKLEPALPVMRAHGVPALMRHLAGQMSLNDAIARGQADTRAYARRQFTWFRHQMPAFQAVSPEDAYDTCMRMLAVPG